MMPQQRHQAGRTVHCKYIWNTQAAKYDSVIHQGW